MPSGALETYIRDIRDIHTSGAGVKETSYYGRLENLLNAVGAGMKPKVKAFINLANRGAGLPDGGLFTSDQFERDESEPRTGQVPARGAMEVKGTDVDVLDIAKRKQVTDYLERYGLVLVTNYRDFLLIRREQDGSHTHLERYVLAPKEEEFWTQASNPHAFTTAHGERFEEFLERVMLQNAPLSNPADVAWFLASYAREARARVENAKSLTALKSVRESLENGLGISFETERGEHFFRSTLVQTLFYGLFSAWVLWCDEHPEGERFEWKLAGWELHVPVIKELFEQLSASSKLQALNLVEVMGWAGDVLNRVQREPFFRRFQQSGAVQYFYEPFLEEFDPELRKQFGVWYTPPEVVRYMVERVDRALRDELGLELGLADENVIVLDPCTGTGSFIVEILNRVQRTLEANGVADALSASDLKQVALHRVIGFEIMPAPFVVAHLQISLRLRRLGSPLEGEERPAVYLTNALTGWKSGEALKKISNLDGLSQERDAAQKVKQGRKILVVLGNPPYSGFAGISKMLEERSLTDAYRTVKRAPAPQGQGLNELYVRFFRLAERTISENGGGRGVVCFISNYSWLDGLSHTGMREKYLETFDTIKVDNLNGDRFKTGKLTPEGEPDPSIFSTSYNHEGIQVGTAIALMTKTGEVVEMASLKYRAVWGKDKLAQLADEADKLQAGQTLDGYETVKPSLELGLPFVPMTVGGNYLEWPKLPDLFPTSFAGVKTSRDDVVTAIERDKLDARMRAYFDNSISLEEMSRISPGSVEITRGKNDKIIFNGLETRKNFLKRDFDSSKIVRYLYKPFDLRWIYWEPGEPDEHNFELLDRARPEYFPHVLSENVWIEARQKQTLENFDRGIFTRVLADNLGNGLSNYFPLFLERVTLLGTGEEVRELDPNLSTKAKSYLGDLDATPEELFHHALAVMHSSAYRTENAGGLRQDWPRIPLPETLKALTEKLHLTFPAS